LTDPEGLWAAQVVDGFERPPKNMSDYVRETESRVVKATLAPDYRTVYLATWRGHVVYGPEFLTERDACLPRALRLGRADHLIDSL
jgi:hypothetical protein